MEWKIELRENNVLLGMLTCYEIDQPWHLCYFEPTKAFEKVKHLFDALKEEDAGNDSFCEADEAIQGLGLEFVSLNGKFEDCLDRIRDFLLYIEDKEARFRY